MKTMKKKKKTTKEKPTKESLPTWKKRKLLRKERSGKGRPTMGDGVAR